MNHRKKWTPGHLIYIIEAYMFAKFTVSLNKLSSPGFIAFINQVLDVFISSDCQLCQILYVGSQQRMFSHSQVTLVLWVEQVTHSLTVDLHVAHLMRETQYLFQIIATYFFYVTEH